jgi:hypothetical protein
VFYYSILSFYKNLKPQRSCETKPCGCFFYAVKVVILKETKLVTADGHALSLATEWIENPEGVFDKQDCERKAFLQLAEKLKKQYPVLPICILADGL